MTKQSTRPICSGKYSVGFSRPVVEKQRKMSCRLSLQMVDEVQFIWGMLNGELSYFLTNWDRFCQIGVLFCCWLVVDLLSQDWLNIGRQLATQTGFASIAALFNLYTLGEILSVKYLSAEPNFYTNIKCLPWNYLKMFKILIIWSKV